MREGRVIKLEPMSLIVRSIAQGSPTTMRQTKFDRQAEEVTFTRTILEHLGLVSLEPQNRAACIITKRIKPTQRIRRSLGGRIHQQRAEIRITDDENIVSISEEHQEERG